MVLITYSFPHLILFVKLQETSMFLKRIYYPEVQLSDLFIGNSFTVFNRVFVVKAHCNSATSKYMTEREVHLLCIISLSHYIYFTHNLTLLLF